MAYHAYADDEHVMKRGKMNWLARNDPRRWMDEPWFLAHGTEEKEEEDEEGKEISVSEKNQYIQHLQDAEEHLIMAQRALTMARSVEGPVCFDQGEYRYPCLLKILMLQQESEALGGAWLKLKEGDRNER